MDTIGIKDWACPFLLCVFFLKETKSHILKKQKHLDLKTKQQTKTQNNNKTLPHVNSPEHLLASS